MKQLVILRGPSGTGKSTIARHLQEQAIREIMPAGWRGSLTALERGVIVPICEADNFWGSQYNFNVGYLGDAHKWCQLCVKSAMIGESECIIASNTSIKVRDLRPYLDLASEFGYEVRIIRSPGPWDVSLMSQRNEHGVPFEVLERQIASYQPHASETEWADPSIFGESNS